jgi:hypothetical protein
MQPFLKKITHIYTSTLKTKNHAGINYTPY